MTQDPINLPARARRLARLRGDIPKHFPLKRFRPGAVVADGFTTTKTEKRMIKRSVFMGNVASSAEAAKEATAIKTKTTPSHPTTSTSISTSTSPSQQAQASTKTPSILRARSSGITKKSKLSSSSLSRGSSSTGAGKVRRPSKKLVTTLTALADALPELSSDPTGAAAAGGGTVLEGVERGKVRHQSLQSKTGALKKKEMVVRGEMERFGVSLARLVGPRGNEAGGVKEGGAMDTDDGRPEGAQDKAQPVISGRWQALRGYITSTMERNPAFISQ